MLTEEQRTLQREILQIHIYLCLLLFCGINNGGAAHFSNLTALAIK